MLNFLKFQNKILPVIFLIIGIFIGKINTKQITKKINEQKNIKIESSLKSITENTKISYHNDKSFFSEKTYSKKGILLHEISYGNNSGASSSEQHFETYKVQTSDTQTSDTKITTIESYQSNWILGVYHPSSLVFKPQDLNLMLSYRVFGNIYVSALSDVKFSKPMVGIQLQF